MIYLDNAATTQVHPEVVSAIAQVLREDFGNPSSRHAVGLAAERHLRAARTTIASALGARESDLVFVSGGTEANALALLGTARRRGAHLLLSAIEHPSVIETARLLAAQVGSELELCPPTPGGWIDPDELEARLRPETALVAVMHVSNEIGIEQPVAELAARVRAKSPRALVLCDAVQSFTHLPTSLASLGVDLLTISAHKIQGPKGVGCLAFRPGTRLAPIWGGGDQEAGRRAGTENLPGIVGLARAVELAAGSDAGSERRCCDAIVETLARELPDAYPLGDPARRAPQLVAIAVPGVPSEVLVNALEELGVCVSSGSACHSRRSLRSHVLDALRVPHQHGVVRFSCSRSSTEAEAHAAADALVAAVRSLRS